MNCTAPGKNRVVAPSELKDQRGARIFYVDKNAVGLFNSSGQACDWTRAYRLVDAHHGKVLANTPARIEFPANDWPAQHGGVSSLKVKTNPLSYVFLSFLRKSDKRQGQTLPSVPLADWVTPEAWVAVSGYRMAKLNYFDGSDAERFTTRVQRQ
jgi:hypothetical protein